MEQADLWKPEAQARNGVIRVSIPRVLRAWMETGFMEGLGWEGFEVLSMRKLVAVFSCLLSCLSAAAADLETRRAAVVAELDALPPLLESAQTCQRIGFHGLAGDSAWVELDLRRRVTPEQVAVFPARLPGTGADQSGFPSAFTVEISDDPSFAARVKIAEWREPEAAAGEKLPFWMAAGNGASGRYLRITVTGFRTGSSDERFFRLGEVVVLANGQNAALRCPVQTSASLDSSRRWEPLNLTDGYFWCLPLLGASLSRSTRFISCLPTPRGWPISPGMAFRPIFRFSQTRTPPRRNCCSTSSCRNTRPRPCQILAQPRSCWRRQESPPREFGFRLTRSGASGREVWVASGSTFSHSPNSSAGAAAKTWPPASR